MQYITLYLQWTIKQKQEKELLCILLMKKKKLLSPSYALSQSLHVTIPIEQAKKHSLTPTHTQSRDDLFAWDPTNYKN